ncbi:SusC/RagA family TonB-linked outer membrane protein [Gemmatimonas sp.]|uniref:SusC/RagA family TonB-linked outer membrane protein n=1 Tax=Gemmatimonas sp. TaxID=1962908 RepID=UPI0025C48950|nr:SusC/RagA family TonB-linked outer membrane protein [Gemmatimonas sp.]MCA2994974.1 SusC/RagA family TonB-linked outer membrane protein [Gemmatimonas sp.]
MLLFRRGAAALAMLIAAAADAHAQRRLTGRVTEEGSNSPLAAASIQVVGTTTGTYTDGSGNFALQVPSGAVSLRVRRIGFQMRTVLVQADQQSVTVELKKDVLQLETQVVTAQSGSIEKRSAATTVSAVNAEELNRVPAMTIDQALQGKVTGARINMNTGAPGGGGQIQIRGTTSILGNGEPLFVIDGVIMSNASIAGGANTLTRAGGAGTNIASVQDNRTNRLADLNPNEIEDIQVLKDAAAAALYGSRATNGVVIITTKRGRAGQPRWNLTQRIGQSSLLRGIGTRCFSDSTSAVAAAASAASQAIAIEAFNASKAANGGRIPCYDHVGQLFGRSPMAWESAASVSGGSDATRYFASASRKYDGGIAVNTGALRDNARINLDQNISSRLQARIDLGYTRSVANRGLSNNGNDPNTSPLYVFGKTPSFLELQTRDGSGNFPVNRFGGGGAAANTSNPFQTFQFVDNDENVDRIVGSATLGWQALATDANQVRVEYQIGVDRFTQDNFLYSPNFLQYEPQDGLPGTVVTTNALSRQFNQVLRANWSFTPQSFPATFRTVAGVTEEQQGLNVGRVRAQGLIPGVVNVNQGQQLTFQNQELQTDQGLFLQTTAQAFNDRLTLGAGIRGDRSSNNGDRDRYFVFPSAQAAYRFEKLLPGVDELKLLANWGQTGNRPLYGQRFITFGNTPFINGVNGIGTNPTLGNPDVRPERKTDFVLGFTMAGLNQRVSLDYAYVDTRIDDVLFNRPIPPTAGISQQIFNGGRLRNRSQEVSLTLVPVQRTSYSWVSRTSFQRIRNVTEILPIPPFNPANVGFGAAYGRPRITQGVSTTAIWGNRPIFRDDGTVVTRDTIIGDAVPDHEMFFTNTFTFGRFTLNTQVDWRQGGDVTNLTQNIWDQFQRSRDYDAPSPCRGQTIENLACVRNAGGRRVMLDTSATATLGAYRFARWNNGNDARVYVQDGSFVKLREVSLTYSVPQSIARRLLGQRVGDVRLNVVGRNLAVFMDYWGMDPEVTNFGNGPIRSAVDLAPFPPSRQFFFSVDVGF